MLLAFLLCPVTHGSSVLDGNLVLGTSSGVTVGKGQYLLLLWGSQQESFDMSQQSKRGQAGR